jgi:lipopolysaccharide biosynthesis protein
MKTQIRTLLITLKNLGAVLKYRDYAGKVRAVGYAETIDDPSYRSSLALAAVHFHRFGIKEILDGDRILNFAVNGKSYRYNEDVYIRLNPDVNSLIESGQIPNGITHFVLHGYDDMLSGRRTNYLSPAIGPILQSRLDFVEHGLERLFVTVDGVEYDWVEELYISSHPEAKLATSPLLHFVNETLPLIEAGKAKLYTEDYSPKIGEIIEGKSKTGANLCLFAHSDPEGLIDPYVVRYLEGLKTMDCEIVFIADSAKKSELDKVLPLCSQVTLRTGHGYDFGSWYVGIKQWRDRFKNYRYVIWANDHFYFPLVPVHDLIQRVEQAGMEVWAAQESWHSPKHMPVDILEYHFECGLVGFSAKAVSAGILDDFVKRFEQYPVLSRIGQSYKFEHWVAAHAIGLNLRVGAFAKVEDDPTINPLFDSWRQAIAWYKSPILAVELVRDDPKQTFSFEELASLVDPSFYDLSLIPKHSARVALSIKPAPHQTVEIKVAKRIDRSPFESDEILCIFSHFDADGRVRPYVLRFLQALEEVGCEFIFVTSSTNEAELAKLPKSVRRILRKSPESEPARDIGAYWLALSDLTPQDLRFKRYLLTNDSVFFPLADHKRMFEEMNAKSLDLWGIVETVQLRWHIQSYFWNFSAKSFKEFFLPTFLADYRFESSRWDMIRNYETRFPNLVRDAGYSVGAYIPIEQVEKALSARHKRETPWLPMPRSYEALYFNPHCDAWDLIVTEFNCPTVKIGFLKNTGGAKAIRRLKALLETNPYYDYSLVEDLFGDV